MVNLLDFGSVYWGSPDFVLAEFVLFVLMFVIISVILEKAAGFDKKSSIVIGIASAILAVVFIDVNLLANYFLTSYSLLGILIVSLFPFVIFFFFIESFEEASIRKVGLVTIGVFYFAIGYFGTEVFSFSSFWRQDASWIYYIVAIVTLLIIIFERRVRKFVFH